MDHSLLSRETSRENFGLVWPVSPSPSAAWCWGNSCCLGIGSALSGALGSYVGGLVDQQLFGPERETRTVTGPRLHDLRVQSSAYGSVTRFEGITVEQRELRTRVDRIEQRDAARSGVAPNSGRPGQ